MKRIICILARGNPGVNADDTIQYLPPGDIDVVPLMYCGKKNDANMAVKVRVGPDAATRLQRALTRALERVSAGSEPRPWLDENHQGGRAVGYPVEFTWGGDDPKSGGVRCRVEWTGHGKELLASGAYAYFSPQLLIRETGETHDVVGFLSNAGGIVNEPAFRGIERISAFSNGGVLITGETDEESKLHNMEELKKLIEAQTERIGTLEKNITDVTSRLDSADKASKDASIAASTTAAKALIASAVQAGRIAAQDTATQSLWEKTLTEDLGRATLLNSLPVNPAMKTITGGSRPAPVADDGSNRAARVRARAEQLNRESGRDWASCWSAADKEIK